MMSSAKKPRLTKDTVKRLFFITLLGFSSGLPFLLIGGTLKNWMAREGVPVETIGYFSWVGLSYSLKFLWAPLVDRYALTKWGRRKSWMLFTQVSLFILLIFLSLFNPVTSLWEMGFISVLISFFSSTQDIVVDAYRREFLPEHELGLGSSFSTYGYRVAMLISGGVGIGLVGSSFAGLTYNKLYFILAFLMLVGMVATYLVPEPFIESTPRTLRAALIEPFQEFFYRPQAWLILFFIFSFKLGDAMSGALLNKFYVDMHFTDQDIGFIAKTMGLISSLVGLGIGGYILLKMGTFFSLVFCGILQSLSTAFFALLVHTGPQRWALGVTVAFEDVSSGMGTAAFLAFISSLTNKKFTATQYALLVSVASLGRNFLSGFSGKMVRAMNWEMFFYTCSLMALPGIALAIYLRRQAERSSN